MIINYFISAEEKTKKKTEFDRIVKFFIFYQDLSSYFFFLQFNKIKSLRKLKHNFHPLSFLI